MTVGSIKRLLTLLNLVAVAALAGTAYGYLSHRESMGEAWQPPDFAVPPPTVSVTRERIDAIKMRLGRYPEKVEVTPEKKEEPVQEIESVLAKLGDIVTAIVAYPPYEPGGLKPAIIFKPRSGGNPITLKLGDAIETRPNPDPALGGHFPVPHRYQFVGCEPDPETPDGVFFLFDMKADGTDIQKHRWKGEIQAKTTAPSGEPVVKKSDNIYVGSGKSEAPAKVETVDAGEEPGTVEPVRPEPTAPVTTAPAGNEEFYGELFDDEDGTFVATRSGVDYLRDNYQKILKDARTETYTDPSSGRRGIQVTNIRGGSVANKFGIQRDDVILAINNRPVAKQAQAVNIVKEELRKDVRVIEVKILRYGQTIVKRYDTRDPATRRAARDTFRDRR